MIAIEKTASVMFDHRALLARSLPFTAFVFLMACGSVFLFLNIHSSWHYFIRVVAALLLLLVFRRQYTELFTLPKRNVFFLSILLGCAVFIFWIIPYPVVLGQPSDTHFLNSIAGDNADFFLFFRFLGSGLVVPLIEELFWRSYVMRRLDQVHFEHLEPSRLSLFSLIVSSVLFAFTHHLWFAGLIAGLAYGLLYRHFQNLWLPIIAHATTNILLGIWIIQFQHWEYW